MNQKNETERFAQAITAMAETFGKNLSTAMLHGYHLGLDGLPIETIERAVCRALRECKFMPSVYELRQLAGEISPENRAVKAWAAVEQAARVHGGYKSVNFDDPIVNATICGLGGWERICELPSGEFDKWLRKDFLRDYQALMQAGISREAAAPLIGYYERQNRMNGMHRKEDEPLRITCDMPPHRPGVVSLPKPDEGRQMPMLENALKEVPT